MGNELSANKSLYLSIVVPLYNEEESVEKLVSRIADVRAQFNFDYEIILVDDGSTDNTWQVIESLKASNPNLRGIKLRRNYGQTNAMVAGFDHAAGEDYSPFQHLWAETVRAGTYPDHCLPDIERTRKTQARQPVTHQGLNIRQGYG